MSRKQILTARLKILLAAEDKITTNVYRLHAADITELEKKLTKTKRKREITKQRITAKTT